MRYSTTGKRLLDVCVATSALLLGSAVMLLIALLVRLKLGTPIIFCQQRPGLRGRPFMIYKFRSMNDRRDAWGRLLADGERLPPFGQFLRSSSLDELPELLNVLRGDMSLVGPRPLLMQYLDRYTPEQARRHDVKPGLTGWAQIHGRNTISWEDRFALDVWYVDNVSFLLDVKITLMTCWKVLKREGISAPGQASISEFMGTYTIQQGRS